MLVLTRRVSEEIFIGDDIKVVVVRIDCDRVRIDCDRVRLGITAPKSLNIVRKELIDDKITTVHRGDEFPDVPMIQVGVDDITDLGRK